METMIAALYVDGAGCYANLPGVDVWDIARDARRYQGPWPVVAHPPCQRWGRFSEGGPSAPGTQKTGDDGGCFEAALVNIRKWGGVIEHPAHSKAWAWFDLDEPPTIGGWRRVAPWEWTCHVEQGHYGHFSRKPTWLYLVSRDPPAPLIWGVCESLKGPDPRAVARVGYEAARRQGRMAQIGGKDKTRIREATPPAFRDALLALARACHVRAAPTVDVA
jgi:hypothetical protein